MLKRQFVLAAGSTAAALLLAACTTTTSSDSGSPAAKRQAINGDVNSALSKLYAQVPQSRELVGRAKGVLVFPSVVSAGFVVGGSYGQGALREGAATSGYYSIVGGSLGWLIGADSRALYVLFMTQEALDRFKASGGWTAGVDANVSVLSVGANGQIDTQTARQAVVGFVLTNAGLMANLSVDGTKISKLDL